MICKNCKKCLGKVPELLKDIKIKAEIKSKMTELNLFGEYVFDDHIACRTRKGHLFLIDATQVLKCPEFERVE